MSLRGWSRDRSSRKVSPQASASYMSNDQFADYLSDLRNTRITRPVPVGARPLPPPNATKRSAVNDNTSNLTADATQYGTSQSQSQGPGSRPHTRANSTLSDSTDTITTTRGRPLVQSRSEPPEQADGSPSTILKPSEVVSSSIYIERGQRWMEKEDVHSIREAMEDMSLTDEQKAEARIYAAAQKEASEIVFHHQHQHKPRNSDAPYNYREYLRKNSYAAKRSVSVNKRYSDVASRQTNRCVSRSSQNCDTALIGTEPAAPRVPTSSHQRKSLTSVCDTYEPCRREKRNISGEINTAFTPDQIYQEPVTILDDNVNNDIEADSHLPVLRRRKSRDNPNHVQPLDQNLSDEKSVSSAKSKHRIEIQRNPPSQCRNPAYTANQPVHAKDIPRIQTPTKDGLEIRSDEIRSATSKSTTDRSPNLPTPQVVSNKLGRPIVSFDKTWTAKGKDRPESLADQVTASMPTPSSPPALARPLLKGPRRQLFGQNRFRSQEETQSLPVVPNTKTFEQSTLPTPQVSSNTPIEIDECLPDMGTSLNSTLIPTIVLPDETPQASFPVIICPDDSLPSTLPTISITEIPIISISDPDITPGTPAPPRRSPFTRPLSTTGMSHSSNSVSAHVVTTDCDGIAKSQTRPLPDPKAISTRPRPLPVPRSTAPVPFNKGHWTVAAPRATATCHECSLPIQGKVVSVLGHSQRFHPECLHCYTCSTPLEALEISPEPDGHRAARLLRIARRAQGEILEEKAGETDMEDGDPRLRFYCHLDWHELYAPRCKHCKTPILGEHAVAVGAHWHYGHFFCAECGDPFEQGMTHIEIDGYAWCVSCSSKRTERRAPKCQGCRKGVVGEYVCAVGGEWHEACFRCCDCGGSFEDGRFFVREDGGISCITCMERVWKA